MLAKYTSSHSSTEAKQSIASSFNWMLIIFCSNIEGVDLFYQVVDKVLKSHWLSEQIAR